MRNQDDHYSNETRMAPFYVMESDVMKRRREDGLRTEYDWRRELIAVSRKLGELKGDATGHATLVVKPGYLKHTRWEVVVPISEDSYAHAYPTKGYAVFTRIHVKDLPLHVVKSMVIKGRFILTKEV